MKTIDKPHGVFNGSNFMTPDVLGYFKLRKGLGYAEFAEGRGFDREPIYGVTVRTGDGKNSDLSKLFHFRSKALAYIEGLS